MGRKKETITLTIKVGKVRKGHTPHTTGSGAHDNRPKRKRTRQAQRSAWQEEV